MGIRRELEERFDFEIIDEFLDHFDMAIESIEPLTIQLEQPEYYARNVDELFRIFHTIKSATGFLQIVPINKFVTKVEELLDTMRSHDQLASVEIVDWLIMCDDHMSVWNTNLRLDEELAELPKELNNLPILE